MILICCYVTALLSSMHDPLLEGQGTFGSLPSRAALLFNADGRVEFTVKTLRLREYEEVFFAGLPVLLIFAPKGV